MTTATRRRAPAKKRARKLSSVERRLARIVDHIEGTLVLARARLHRRAQRPLDREDIQLSESIRRLELARHPGFREACWLIRNGVPFHSAMGMTQEQADGVALDRIERAAFSIIFSELESGKRFDLRSMTFVEDKN